MHKFKYFTALVVIALTSEVFLGLTCLAKDTQKDKVTEFDYEDIKVVLQNCKRYYDKLQCLFMITAKLDGEVMFSCGSEVKMYDPYGREYYCDMTQIGQSRKGGGSRTQAGIGAATRMLKGIPLQARIEFFQLPIEVKKIAAIKIGVSLSNENRLFVSPSEYHAIEIRDIAILDPGKQAKETEGKFSVSLNSRL